MVTATDVIVAAAAAACDAKAGQATIVLRDQLLIRVI